MSYICAPKKDNKDNNRVKTKLIELIFVKI